MAATSRLTKTRRWFDLCTGSINRSWLIFRSALISRFKRKILYSAVIQKVESRRWIFSKESFSDYAMNKLALMAPLKLLEEDNIQLLINGISSVAIKGTAAFLKIDSLDEFLRDMQHITATCNDVVKKSPSTFRRNKSKDQSRPSSPKSDQEKKLFCAYCRGRNHTKENCFKLNRKEQPANSTQIKKNVSPSTVASVSEPPEIFKDTIAFVDTDDSQKIVTSNTNLKVSKIGASICELVALLDTGSPVSFISRQTFDNFFKLTDSSMIPNCSYNALNVHLYKLKI